jgi:hypothetical protein
MDELGVHVTFFWNGQNVPGSRIRLRTSDADDDKQRGEDMRKAALAGHSTATHGLSHKELSTVIGEKGLTEHVIEGAEVLEKTLNTKGEVSLQTNQKVNLYRPPYGSWSGDANKFFSSKLGSGFHVIRWDVDIDGSGINFDALPGQVGGAMHGNGGSEGHVFLLHERKEVIKEVTDVVNLIRKECPNCEFWSIDQCFQAEAEAQKAKDANKTGQRDPIAAAKITTALNSVLHVSPSEDSQSQRHSKSMPDKSEQSRKNLRAKQIRAHAKVVPVSK